MPASFIYKPNTYKGPVVLVPSEGPQTPPVITLPDGSKITGKYLNTNEGRHQFVFPRDIIGQQGITIDYGGQSGSIGNGAMSYEGSSIGGWDERFKGSMQDPSAGAGGSPQSAGGYGGLPNPYMMMFQPVNFNPISYKPINYDPIQAAPYKFTDPIEAAKRYNTFNKEQEQNAFDTGIKRGQQLTDLDTNAISNFANKMSGLQMNLVGAENAFNQAQRLKAVDFALPDLRSTLDAKRDRASTYASGRLLNSAEDRAYEVAARSASADGSFVRGFGDDSVFGKRTSDILSAQQRLGISQMGEGMLNDWISQGSSILIDTPLKSSISQRLPSTPPILPSQQATQQQGNLANMTTVPLQFGISSEINQNQFSTNLEQGTRTFNAGNTFSKDQFNAGNQLQTDSFNASNDLGAQQFNSSGAFQASQAQFSGLQTNYDRATNAANRADDIRRQELHNEAASSAADSNISAQQDAGNAGAGGSIGGAIIGGVLDWALGGSPLSLGGGGGGSVGSGGKTPAQTAGGMSGGSITGGGHTFAPTGAQSLSATLGSTSTPQVSQDTSQVEDINSQVAAPPQSGTQGGASRSYSGSSIPVSSSEFDPAATAPMVSQGIKQTGALLQNLGRSGPSTPQVSSLGNGLASGANSAQEITSSFQTVGTPEAEMSMADNLKAAALKNANTPEAQASIETIFSQVREHLDTGVGVKGQAAGIAGFIKNYNDYSDPERVRGITNISFAGQDLKGEYGVDNLDADTIGKIPVAGTNNRMTVKDAVSLQNSGYNVSGLVTHWDEISAVTAALGGKEDLLSVASTGRDLNLAGTDTPESINQRQLALREAGASGAGAWGAGAVSVPSSNRKQVERQGYVAVGNSSDGQVVAVPRSAAASAGLTFGIIGSGMDEVGLNKLPLKNLQVSQTAKNNYDNWSTDFVPKNTMSMGDRSAVASGLYALGNKDPYKLGTILLTDLHKNGAVISENEPQGRSARQESKDIYRAAEDKVGNAATQGISGKANQIDQEQFGGKGRETIDRFNPMKPMTEKGIEVGIKGINAAADKFDSLKGSFGVGGGKNEAQGQRDNLRSLLEDNGFTKNNQMEFLDGTTFDIGKDGGRDREWNDPSLRRPDQQNVDKLGAYDLDYTRDIDAVMNLSGNALAVLQFGNPDDNAVRQMGNYYTNGVVSKSKSADLNMANFSTVQAEMANQFKRAGIETRDEAYALSNQLKTEGRVTDMQLVQIQQGINLAFDKNAYQGATQLLEGVKLGRKGEDLKEPKSSKKAPSSEAVPVNKGPEQFNKKEGPKASTSQSISKQDNIKVEDFNLPQIDNSPMEIVTV